MYRRIAQELREQIRSGLPEPGGQLPTELELAERYDASRNTVRDAIRWLAANGLVETRPGQGTFVVSRITPLVTTLSADPGTAPGGEGAAALAEVTAQGRHPSVSAPRVAVQLATGTIATLLRIADGGHVVSRQEERFIDGIGWSLKTTYYPMELVAQGASLLISAEGIPGGAASYLRGALGVEQVGYRDQILVRPPDDDESKFFRLPDDGRIPLVTIVRTGYRASEDGPVPYRLTFLVLPADRNELVINYGEVPVS
jgi:GntR family transcriptional regulator